MMAYNILNRVVSPTGWFNDRAVRLCFRRYARNHTLVDELMEGARMLHVVSVGMTMNILNVEKSF
jgi:hypothetical protein